MAYHNGYAGGYWAGDITASIGQFQRLGTTRLHIARLGHSGRGGFRSHDEGWERVSDVFVFDEDAVFGTGTADQAMKEVAAAWAAHAGSDAATLKTAIHTALDAYGFRRRDGSRLI